MTVQNVVTQKYTRSTLVRQATTPARTPVRFPAPSTDLRALRTLIKSMVVQHGEVHFVERDDYHPAHVCIGDPRQRNAVHLEVFSARSPRYVIARGHEQYGYHTHTTTGQIVPCYYARHFRWTFEAWLSLRELWLEVRVADIFRETGSFARETVTADGFGGAPTKCPRPEDGYWPVAYRSLDVAARWQRWTFERFTLATLANP